MFYLFFLAANCPFHDVKRMVVDLLEGAELNADSADELELTTDVYHLTVTEGGDGVKFRSEDYRMSLDVQMWFDLYDGVEGRLNELMRFIGAVMQRHEGDCLLESNGDTAILLRKEQLVIADDSRLNGTQRFPFEHLGVSYREGTIALT
ncbi:SitI3 family protein [Paenibacillus tepidiphilus]|uniref:SitI3 family protein n=1 Tax=Paenibacillus tepidiphilus TaxID=2608683 RepID=UPI001239C6B5|nr:SitI3 family protein [Paenibacillus tepidiphilus]